MGIRAYTSEAKTLTWDGTTYNATWEFTTVAGDDVLVVFLVGGTVSAPSGMSFDDINLTVQATQSDANYNVIGLYDLDEPHIGTLNLKVWLGVTKTYHLVIMALTDVDPDTPRGTLVKASQWTTTPQATCNTEADQIVIGGVATYQTHTNNESQTVLLNNVARGTAWGSVAHKTAVGATTTLGWNQGTSSYSARIAIPYIFSEGGATPAGQIITTMLHDIASEA